MRATCSQCDAILDTCHVPVGTARARASLRGGGCVVLTAHAREREGQVTVHDES